MGKVMGLPLPDERDLSQITNWLQRLARAVEHTDYVAGRRLQDAQISVFAANVPEMLRGIDKVQEKSWERVWPSVDRCSHAKQEMMALVSPDQKMAVVAMPANFAGKGFDVDVRVTYALWRTDQASDWRAAHAHYSTP